MILACQGFSIKTYMGSWHIMEKDEKPAKKKNIVQNNIDGLPSEITKNHYTKYHEGLKNVVAIMHWPLSRSNY